MSESWTKKKNGNGDPLGLGRKLYFFFLLLSLRVVIYTMHSVGRANGLSSMRFLYWWTRGKATRDDKSKLIITRFSLIMLNDIIC